MSQMYTEDASLWKGSFSQYIKKERKEVLVSLRKDRSRVYLPKCLFSGSLPMSWIKAIWAEKKESPVSYWVDHNTHTIKHTGK